METRLDANSRGALRPFFRDYPVMPGCVEAALEGRVGHAIADDPVEPTAAMLEVDFFFLAGDPHSPGAERLVRRFRPGQPAIIVPDTGWATLLKRVCGPRLESYTRTSYQAGNWNREHLEMLAQQTPSGIAISRLESVDDVRRFGEHLTESMVLNFGSPEDFLARGIAFGAEHNGRYIAGISSFAQSQRTLEIEVFTHRNYRRRGLASALGARLILYCLDQGLRPSWDAANPSSAALAEKLGFRRKHTYQAYYIPSTPV